MEDFRSELTQMVQDLKASFNSKITILENGAVVISYKQSEINNIDGRINIFQDCSDNAVHTNNTMPVFRKEFEIIKRKINEL